MLHVVTLIWDANGRSKPFSTMYDESWVRKLYAGFKRNLTRPFKFVVFTDRERDFGGLPIHQERISAAKPDYSTCIEPYRLNAPMILVGLDTIVTGNIDHLADYCMEADTIALPRDPFNWEQACNGVALVPAGKKEVFEKHTGQNDMDHMRSFPHVFIDDLWPDQVPSYKGSVKAKGIGDARIVYFHGREKPHELNLPWVKQHWSDIRKPSVALLLGGANTVWKDVDAALDIGEFAGVVACNDAGAHWSGWLDGWCSLHSEKLGPWASERKAKGYPDARETFIHEEAKKFPGFNVVQYRFKGQHASGSSGLFVAKVALDHMKFDRAVCCGIPLTRETAHFFSDPMWNAAIHHRRGWEQSMPVIKDRLRSMSGWTKGLLGAPDADFLNWMA